MRIKNKKQSIDYSDTKGFFDRRAKKYNALNPYSVTMYQDDHADLVSKRNEFETKKLLNLLKIDAHSRVLDLACGIGRWSDALNGTQEYYLGVDFSEDLIRIAKERNQLRNSDFKVGSVTDLDRVLGDIPPFNRILMVGIMMYLNDEDVSAVTRSLNNYCAPDSYICLREPLGIGSRLTLKEFYSSELKDSYNAIYRTRDEIVELIRPSLLDRGFVIEEEGFLFDDVELNNRKETAQYYFILKRE